MENRFVNILAKPANPGSLMLNVNCFLACFLASIAYLNLIIKWLMASIECQRK